MQCFNKCVYTYMYIHICVCLLGAQLYPAFCEPRDCSQPGSSVHVILQTRILEWIAIPFSRGFSQPRDQTWVSCIASRFLTVWATIETPSHTHTLTHAYIYWTARLKPYILIYDYIHSKMNFFLNSVIGLEVTPSVHLQNIPWVLYPWITFIIRKRVFLKTQTPHE